jgi:hypothetical protein
MKILFDQGTPAPLRHALPGRSISTAYEMGWAKLENGDLLTAVEKRPSMPSLPPIRTCAISKTLALDDWLF